MGGSGDPVGCWASGRAAWEAVGGEGQQAVEGVDRLVQLLDPLVAVGELLLGLHQEPLVALPVAPQGLGVEGVVGHGPRLPAGQPAAPGGPPPRPDSPRALDPGPGPRSGGATCTASGSVERAFGRLKHEWAMPPLRTRRMARVQLHVDLTILAELATALATARAVPLAA